MSTSTSATRIVTVTPNPSLDRTIELAGELQRGAVQRAVHSDARPGGKGVNVSRVVASSGGDTLAVLPGDPTDPVVTGLAALGIPTSALPIGAPIRSNVTVTEPTGTTTKLNEPGPSLARVAQAFTARVVSASEGAAWVVLAGSLPPGLPDDALATLASAIRAADTTDTADTTRTTSAPAPRIAVDSSGVPFTTLVASGVPIDLIKPNAEELAEVVGGDPAEYEADPALTAAAATRLQDRGIATVLVTLGGAGAVLVTPDGAWSAAAPRIAAKSTVGAGDSALAGYLLAEVRGATPPERLAQAVAAGAAAASLPGSEVPSLATTDPGAIRVVRLEPAVAGPAA